MTAASEARSIFLPVFFLAYLSPKTYSRYGACRVIEAAGPAVSAFQAGDEVFGITGGLSFGTHAEYICLRETSPIAVRPANVHGRGGYGL